MANPKTQVTAVLTSPSGSIDCRAMQVQEVVGREALSELFVFDVTVVIQGDASFEAHTTLGLDLKLTFLLDGTEVRSVYGIVAEAVDADPQESMEDCTYHRLRIVPRLHRLGLNASCEVFLGKSVVERATEKLSRVGLSGDDLSVQVSDSLPLDEFRLQYAESDLAFVARHLEHAGITFSFDHSGQKDVLVLSDDNSAFGPSAGPASIPYTGRGAGVGLSSAGIVRLEKRSTLMTARHEVADYLPGHPRLDVHGEATLTEPVALAGTVVTDFGSGHASPAEGRHLALMRAQSRLALAQGLEGSGAAPQVEAGRTISVAGHPRVSSDPLLVVWVEHHLTSTMRVVDADSATSGYRNTFRVIPATQVYRPALRTPRPRISGFVYGVTDVPKDAKTMDTALIDEHGRYTVHLMFDKSADPQRQVSSARMRMAQPHAGPGYGMHFPLKPGVEVAVAFYEGDPDRPVIAAAVPNALTWTPAMDKNAKIHHLQTGSGVSLKMRDA